MALADSSALWPSGELLTRLPQSEPPAELAEAYREALRAEEYQNSLPEPDTFPHFEIPSFVAVLFEILAWIFLAAVVVFLVTMLVRLILARRRHRLDSSIEKDELVSGPLIKVEDLDIDLERIKAMAGAGALAEAIHLLLIQTLQSLGRLSKIELDPSWTSREILGRIELAPGAKTALVGLVSTVEVSHFGDSDPTPEDFERSLQSYEAFVQALRVPRS
ncbi:MAG: DUF4129 domain-containing protein [Planctomycetota bacterium]